MTDSTITIACVAPELLGTYGDRGNALILRQRLRWRGHDAEILEIDARRPIPDSCDIYLLGGGEDSAQRLVLSELAGSRGLQRAAERNAVILGVCAGYQMLGEALPDGLGRQQPGLGILDVVTVDSSRPRAVGEVLAISIAAGVSTLGLLTGFENHGRRTRLGASVTALATVKHGIGNGYEHTEGAVTGHVIGTYLHGPVLARNPALADQLIEWIVGPLPPLQQPEIDRLRQQRLTARTPRRRQPHGRSAANTRNHSRELVTHDLGPVGDATPGNR